MLAPDRPIRPPEVGQDRLPDVAPDPVASGARERLRHLQLGNGVRRVSRLEQHAAVRCPCDRVVGAELHRLHEQGARLVETSTARIGIGERRQDLGILRTAATKVLEDEHLLGGDARGIDAVTALLVGTDEVAEDARLVRRLGERVLPQG